MKIPALTIINNLLLEHGLKQEDIDLLMARFLEEEAHDFVEDMKEEDIEYSIKRIYKA